MEDTANNASVLRFENIHLCVKDKQSTGLLKMTEKGVAWKSQQTGKVTSVPIGDLESIGWVRGARGYEVKLGLQNQSFVRFQGFEGSNREALREFFKEKYNKDLQELEMSVKGWNSGDVDVVGSQLVFSVDSKPLFEVPLGDITQPTMSGKNELSIEFVKDDTESKDQELVEMRFYIPDDSAPAGSDEEENAVSEKENTLKKLHKLLSSKSSLMAQGEAIASFSEMPCVTPRGRYEIEMHPSFIRLHGKTYDYKLLYSSVLRLFLLPKADQRYVYFVISVDPPIRQGQTRYPYLILQFPTDEEIEIELNLKEEEIQEKYDGKLMQKMNGPTYEVVSRIFKALSGRKITVPGSFKSYHSSTAVKCSLKANDGNLFPLEKGFIFVHKPCCHIRFDEISHISFARVGKTSTGTSRTFDLDIQLTSGTVHSFTGIQREEYSSLHDFIVAKRLRIKNLKNQEETSLKEDDFEASESEEEEKHRSSGDDEEEDLDFKGDVSASDVSEEYDSNPSEDDDDSSDASQSGSDAGDDDDEEGSEEGGEQESDQEDQVKKVKKENPKKVKKEEPASSEKSRKRKAASSPTNHKGKSRKKAPKDPNAPKRPMSSYMLWCNSERTKLKSENPSLSNQDLLKELGNLWKALSDPEKQKWTEKAEVEKKRYEQEKSAYQKSSQASKQPAQKAQKAATTASVRESGQYKSAEFVDSDSGEQENHDEDE